MELHAQGIHRRDPFGCRPGQPVVEVIPDFVVILEIPDFDGLCLHIHIIRIQESGFRVQGSWGWG